MMETAYPLAMPFLLFGGFRVPYLYFYNETYSLKNTA